jgi:hypothetical protein
MARQGRNDACACGSGKKFKHCCALKDGKGPSRLVVALVAGTILVAIILAFASARNGSTPGRVWSAEHGHYHDASGREIPR